MSAIDTDVLILGGGLAGLTCAVGLGKSGLGVTILERDTILGGRARSWIDSVTGDAIPVGPHILLTEYHNFLRLLSVLGTRDRLVWQSRRRFITMVDGRRETVMKMAPLPPPMPFVPSVFADRSIPDRDKVSNFPLTLMVMQMGEEDFLRLDAEDAVTFLRRAGVSQLYIDRFWAFTAMAIMNVPVELCSAGALMRFYRRLIGHREFSVGFPDGGLGDVFAPAARAMIEAARGRILLSTEAVAIEPEKNLAARLADGRTIRARFLVSTLPPQDLLRILPPAWLADHAGFRALDGLLPCPYVSPFLWFDRKLTRRQFWARKLKAGDLNCDFYDLANINGALRGRPSLIASNIIYSHRAAHLPDAEVVARTIDEIAELLPGVRRARLVHSVVNRIPMAIHCPHPGTERRRLPQRTAIEGFFLAGDWVKTGLPSSMESAVMSGWRAAEHILEATGRPAKLAVEHKGPEGFVRLFGQASRWFPRKWRPESLATR